MHRPGRWTWALVFLGSCASPGNEGQRNPNVIIEHELADGTRRATWDDTVVLFLEAGGLLGDAPAAGDTSTPGVDRVPFDSEGGRHTFCFQDPDGLPHRFRVLGSDGAPLLSLDAGGCEEVDLPAGPYTFELEHAQRGNGTADTVPIFLQPRNLDVAGRAAAAEEDGGLGRFSRALVDSCTPTCIPQAVRYGDVKNHLSPNQVLLFTGTCPPGDDDTVYRYSTSCGDTGQARVTGAQAAQFTAATVFWGPGLNGPMWGLANSSVLCLGEPQARQLVTARFALRIAARSDCGVTASAYQCWGCVDPNQNTATPGLKPGQVLLFGGAKSGDCCHAGLVFDGDCSDLGLLGFDDVATRVVLGSGTAAMLYGDPGMKGLSQQYRLPGTYDLAPDGGGVLVGAGMVSSLLVGTQEQVNRGILIAGRSCGGCDLRGVDLTNANLAGAYLAKADLTDAKLTGTQLPGANLYQATLKGARLRLANLQGANLQYANLSPGAAVSDLSQAWLAGAQLDHASLVGANCQQAHFSGGNGGSSLAAATLTSADFTGAVLREVSLKGASMAGAKFQGAWLVNADLSSLGLTMDASVSAVLSFEDAWLQGADFTGTVLDKANLEGARFALSPGGVDVPEYTSMTVAAAGPTYVTEWLNYRYAAQYPNRMPHQTTSNTICPDSTRGPCRAIGGESVHSCPDECRTECETRVNCLSLPWPAGAAGGHWECPTGTCAAVAEDATTGSRCGDRMCDRVRGETAASCSADCARQCVPGNPRGCLALPWPAGVGPGSWRCDENGQCQARASRFVCGGGTCLADLGKSAASCPADCGPTFRCEQAQDCLGMAWTAGTPWGHWSCTAGSCVAVASDGACATPCSYAAGLPVGCPCCGDGRCDLVQGEGPGTCPADCQGGGCAAAAECASLAWTAPQEGHWECAADRTCQAVPDTTLDATRRECGGGDGQCHFHGQWERRPDLP